MNKKTKNKNKFVNMSVICVMCCMFFSFSYQADAADSVSGVYVSDVQTLSAHGYFDLATWEADVPSGTNVTLKVRSANNGAMTGAPDWDLCTTAYTVTGNGSTNLNGNNCLTNGQGYVQYRVELATSDGDVVPTFDGIVFGFKYPTIDQTLTSSIYDIGFAGASLSQMQWGEILAANTDVRFQIRTSSNGSTWSAWCGPDNNVNGSCNNGTFFTDPSGVAEIIDDVQRDGVNDRYVQYKVFLSTADGVQKPIVTDVSLGYNMIELPQVSTEPATNITGSTALGHATVIVTGGENVTRYIQWGTISGSYVGSCSAGVGASGTYACTMSGLLPNTTYYMRARVTNSAGAANGNEVSFHTAIVPSSISTRAVSDITVASAMGNGRVTASGGENPERFIQWGTQSGVYTHECSAGVGGTGYYACAMSDLAVNTKYYVRAKTVNSIGVSYGAETSFSTLSGIPIAKTRSVTAISLTSATGNGYMTYAGGENPERFIQWGTQSGVYTHECSAGVGSTGYFSCAMTGLSVNTKYYARIKAVNRYHTTYGSETSFTTLSGIPAATTYLPVNVDVHTATGKGYISATGGENPERFIQWGTQSGVYTHECSAGVGGTGYYACAMTGLEHNTTYYVRAKAVTSYATAYSTVIKSFTTKVLPDITIQDPNADDIQGAVSGGYLTVENGDPITNTDIAVADVNVAMITNHAEVLFSSGTSITEVNDEQFDFSQFTIANVTEDVQDDQEDVRIAIRIGVPGEQLDFSQDVTLTVFVGEAFNDLSMNILYQYEGDAQWHEHDVCVVQSGYCTFVTDHATIYTINGVHQSTGDAPVNINVEVQETLSLDCYDKNFGSGDTVVALGTTGYEGIVIAGTPAVGESVCDVTTNADQGYYLTIVDDNGPGVATLTHEDPHDAGVIYEIDDLTQWNESVMATEHWVASHTKGLGFSVVNFPETNTINNSFDGAWTVTEQCPEGADLDLNDYAGVPDIAQAISAVTAYQSNTTTTDICYKVDVPASQPSGQYAGSITFTATSDASGYYQ